MENKCDIVLLSYESPDLLKECVRSVLDHTRVKSRLIIVDNNSRSPEVKKYIEAVDGNETVE
ncbi:MAG: glycosyltransferase, partial [Candidatus Omnitrophota bacterium]